MECIRSTNNQHVGVNLKACAIIMMDAFCYCTPSKLLSVSAPGQKLLIDGIKPSWSPAFVVCYQVCFGALSQGRVIGFPMLLSLGMWTATGWAPTEMGWVCLPPETLSRASEDAAEIPVCLEIKRWPWRLDVETDSTECVRYRQEGERTAEQSESLTKQHSCLMY